MGEVFRARDTKLHREVVIEVLPAAVAHDPERRERFEREAQTIAAESSEHRHDPRRRAPAARARRESARRRARGERGWGPRER